jgi:carboxylesterase type B
MHIFLDPTRLVLHSLAARKPFIAVVINYRLNIFGFAASSNIVAAQKQSQLRGCNFGINDQKIALKWTSENISSFGGDPQNITLGGQSAGGCSVNTHILEGRSSSMLPLFRRAIIQSGAFTSVGIGPVPLEECEKRWNSLCDYFGIKDQPGNQQVELLRRMPAEDLIKAGGDLGWMIFFLASDNLTITALSETEWSVDFDQKQDVAASRPVVGTDPIEVLIGDTEAEVSPISSCSTEEVLITC